MPGVSRDEVKNYLAKGQGDATQRRLAELRLEYSEIGKILDTYLASLDGKERIYPTILPTQASGRWSYIDPPLSSFPKKCLNPRCPQVQHEKTELCWNSTDCLMPDEGTYWIDHDLNAVEHCIYCLILGWSERLEDLKSGVDIHTPVTCSLFNLPLPSSRNDPHKAVEDAQWRALVGWEGKDDSRRTISKNFTYGGQYFYVRLARAAEKTRLPYKIYKGLWYNPTFVYTIPNIHSFLIKNTLGELIVPEYEKLAINFVQANVEIQKRKAEAMEKCRKDKVSRTLYGGKRHGWFSNQDTAKKLFNHRIQGTVASYINESCLLLQKSFPDSYLVHNKHDSLKWAFRYQSSHRQAEEAETLAEVKKLTQRTLVVAEYSIPITATYKIIRREDD